MFSIVCPCSTLHIRSVYVYLKVGVDVSCLLYLRGTNLNTPVKWGQFLVSTKKHGPYECLPLFAWQSRVERAEVITVCTSYFYSKLGNLCLHCVKNMFVVSSDVYTRQLGMFSFLFFLYIKYVMKFLMIISGGRSERWSPVFISNPQSNVIGQLQHTAFSAPDVSN